MKNARQVVLDALLEVLKNDSYSNITLNKHLTESKLNKTDSSFATALYYGVIQRLITLDYVISRYYKNKLSKLDIEVLTILRMGVYQLVYLNSVPDNAAVNESVALVMYARKTSAKGLVNAILRNFIRDNKVVLESTDKLSPIKRASLEYSCPEWLLKMISQQYDLATAIEYAKSSVEVAPLVVRVNTIKNTQEQLIAELEKVGIEVEKSPILENCLILKKVGDIENLQQFKQGKFYVQDTASQLCASVVNAKPGDTVLDICSAPGSKSFTIAQYMENKGEIHAFDVHDHKIKLIDKSAKKLGIDIINSSIQDGTKFNPDIKSADVVLCDVPCSGLGIIRRKPEIKFKDKKTLETLPPIQYEILENSAKYVKNGGVLIYSTCTINKDENVVIINKFLKENSAFRPLNLSKFLSKIYNGTECYVTLFPHINQCDGFFIAALEKSGE